MDGTREGGFAVGRVVLAVVLLLLGILALSSAVSRGISVAFDVEAERPFVCSVYYSEAGGRTLDHVDARVSSGRSRVRLTIPSPCIGTLRVDYGTSPGRVVSGRVLVAGDRREVLDWKDFGTIHDIARRELSANGRQTIVSEGRDPFVVYGKELGLRSGLLVRRSWLALGVLALVAALSALLWNSRPLVGFRRWLAAATGRLSDRTMAGLDQLAAVARPLLPDRTFAVYMAAVVLLAWGFELFNFTFTSDDDVVLFGGFPPSTWLEQGRWGMYVLEWLHGNNSVPVVPLAATLVLYSLTYGLVFGYSGRSRYFLFPLYVAFPVVYQSFSFSSLNPGVGIAFVCAALAARLSLGGGVAWCVAVLMGACAIGCYQIFLFYMALVVVVFCLDRVWREPAPDWRGCLAASCRGAVMVVAAYAVYKAVQHGFQLATGVTESYVTGRYLDPPRNLADLRAWLPLALSRIRPFLMGTEGVFPRAMTVHPVLLASAGLAIAVWAAFSRRRPAVRMAVVACCVLLPVLAFLPLVFNRRAFILNRIIALLVPTALVAVLALADKCVRAWRPGPVLGALLCALCGFQFVWGINQMAYSNFLQNRHDMNFVAQVRNRIETIPEVVMRRSRGLPVPLLVVGRSAYDRRGAVQYARRDLVWPEWEHDNAGRSLFVSPGRWRFALRACLGTVYAAAPMPAQLPARTIRFIENMPVWPLNGSVVWRDGCAVVKFSDFAPVPASPTRKAPRRLCRCGDSRVNGFDELVQTPVDPKSLVHRYAGRGEALLTCPPTRGGSLELAPFRAADPYLVLEIRATATESTTLDLWKGSLRQMCQFALSPGENVLRLRVPREFLAAPLPLALGVGGNRISEVRVYADRAFARDLLDLNPGLRGDAMFQSVK